MIYLKINEEIRILIELVKDSFKLGCKEYCRHGLIALDEFELLRKELEFKKFKIFNAEEYKGIIKSTESFYFHNTHVCTSDQGVKSIQNSEEENEEDILNELKKDKIQDTKKKVYFAHKSSDYYETEYLRKKQEEEESNSNTKSEIAKIRSESSISYALSMVASLFLLVLGSYYLGKYFFEMNDSNTYKLVLVITIIVLISEMVLLVIKMNRESEKKLTPKKIKESSFAYKFNKKYRDQCIVEQKNKVHPAHTQMNNKKAKTE